MSATEDTLIKGLREATATQPAARFSTDEVMLRGRARARRHRMAMVGGGCALALLAGVPLAMSLPGESTTGVATLQVAGQDETPTDPVAASPYALDPAAPWEYRGDPQVLGSEGMRDIAAAVAEIRGDSVEVTPLYAELGESVDGQVERQAGTVSAFFVAQHGDGTASWGYAESSPTTAAHVLVDEPLEQGQSALAAVVPTWQGDQLVVVTAPTAVGGLFAADGAAFASMDDVSTGVYFAPVDGSSADARWKVVGPDSTAVAEGQLASVPAATDG